MSAIQPIPIIGVTATTRVRPGWSSPFVDAFLFCEVWRGFRLVGTALAPEPFAGLYIKRWEHEWYRAPGGKGE